MIVAVILGAFAFGFAGGAEIEDRANVTTEKPFVAYEYPSDK